MIEFTAYCNSQSKEQELSYTELLKRRADATDIQEYLIGGDTVAVTIRIPRNLRDSAKEAAALRGTTFSALIRESVINDLSKDR
ncbi:MAG: hypothetical protein IJH88_01120 [Eggerthellaceae bacterium]|nr:hypothetical protein [Eggerthellaceae bacterium]